MSEDFKVEIVNPDKSFLVKEDASEVVVPAFEGEMGILKDHISIISFLRPGIIKIFSKSGDENYFVEDGIIEFKNNSLSILTSSIFKVSDIDKSKQQDLLKQAEQEAILSRASVEDKLDNKLEEIKSKIDELSDIVEREKTNLRQPRKITEPE